MTQESLRELLARVHEHLSAGGGSLDRESQRLLGTLMRDIERALGTGAPEPAAAQSVAAHAPRLESLAVRFEAGHPALAETLRELIDALVKAGI
jgi:hypothetical protein